MKKIGILVLLMTLIALPGMAKTRSIRGSEQQKIQEVYSVEPFSNLMLRGQLEVEFTQGPQGTYTVEFAGPYNLAELVEIKSMGGTLSLRYREPLSILGDDRVRVRVAAPNVESIQISDSGEIHAHTPITVENLSITADGNAELEINDLTAQHLHLNLSGNAEVEIDKLVCQHVNARTKDSASLDLQQTQCEEVIAHAFNRSELVITGLNGQSVLAENTDASEIELKGKVQKASLVSRGRGEIDARGLQAENANVMAAKSARIEVRVSGMLTAESQDRAIVEYKGWPQQINRTGKGVVRQDHN